MFSALSSGLTPPTPPPPTVIILPNAAADHQFVGAQLYFQICKGSALWHSPRARARLNAALHYMLMPDCAITAWSLSCGEVLTTLELFCSNKIQRTSHSGAYPGICERGPVSPIPFFYPSSLFPPLPLHIEVWPLKPVGSGAEPRPRRNLVHSKAVRKPLVAIIFNILSTMCYNRTIKIQH